MKFSVLLLLASVLALLSLGVESYEPKAICYKKTQKCCFGFHPCGYIVKKTRFEKRCDYVVCKKICKPYCRNYCVQKKVRVPKQHCKPQYVKVCKREEVERYGKWIWINKCSLVRRGQRCYTTYHYVPRRVCSRKCYRKCYNVCHKIHAICVSYRIYHYHKFCPKLVCYDPVYHGPYKVPAHVVSPKGALVKTTKPVRKVIGKRRH